MKLTLEDVQYFSCVFYIDAYLDDVHEIVENLGNGIYLFLKCLLIYFEVERASENV